jgi:hemerythrin-like metal-binding protein
MFEWKDDYLVGVTTIDEQHKQLFRLAERFHQAVVANKGKAMLGELLDALIRYTEGHFQVEERLMASCDYPEHEQHSAQHQDLRKRLSASQQRFESGETVTILVLQFMSRLATHITSTDRRLGDDHQMKKDLRPSPEESAKSD